jgi:D-sedoheptulose 7-phosphate isomerase
MSDRTTHLADLRAALDALDRDAARLERWAAHLAATLHSGGRLLAAGNGGSAAQAQHLVAELVGKLDRDRPPLSAIALSAETCGLTAIGNDYGFEQVFARQVTAHSRPGDVVILLSTSGGSPNVLTACQAAKASGAHLWAMTGAAPNPLAGLCDDALAVRSRDTQVVQEVHLIAVHLLCARLDVALAGLPVREAIGQVSRVGAPA